MPCRAPSADTRCGRDHQDAVASYVAPKRRRFCALGVARKPFIISPRLLHISFRVTVLGDPHKHSADYLWCFPNGPQRLTALGPFFRPGDIIAGVALANLALAKLARVDKTRLTGRRRRGR